MSRWVFAEPEDPGDGPFRGLADWYRRSGSERARAARGSINSAYATFPDRDNVVLSRLRGDDDVGVRQATDELYVHGLLSQSCEATYEENDTSRKRPDFRLYRSSEYLAAVEVLTLFMEDDFDSEVARNGRLVDEITPACDRHGGTSTTSVSPSGGDNLV